MKIKRKYTKRAVPEAADHAVTVPLIEPQVEVADEGLKEIEPVVEVKAPSIFLPETPIENETQEVKAENQVSLVMLRECRNRRYYYALDGDQKVAVACKPTNKSRRGKTLTGYWKIVDDVKLYSLTQYE